jgi:hypothetical protein
MVEGGVREVVVVVDAGGLEGVIPGAGGTPVDEVVGLGTSVELGPVVVVRLALVVVGTGTAGT